jgi:hypothetical protein
MVGPVGLDPTQQVERQVPEINGFSNFRLFRVGSLRQK